MLPADITGTGTVPVESRESNQLVYSLNYRMNWEFLRVEKFFLYNRIIVTIA